MILTPRQSLRLLTVLADQWHVRVFDVRGEVPDELQAACRQSGIDLDDADWLAIVPPSLAGESIPWMREGTDFGCCSVRLYPLPDGGEIRVGHHS